jgi:RNA polymerase sigma-70 factor (ECF subfamily)
MGRRVAVQWWREGNVAQREAGRSAEVDPTIVDRARDGDFAAYEQLARATADRLYPVAWRILRDRDRADDAVQKTLVAIWRELPRLRDSAAFASWSYRIVVRFCTQELRSSHPYDKDVYELDIGSRPTEGTTMVARRDELARGFQRLSPEHRAVVVLVYYEGLTMDEAAAVLDIAPGTVASRLHYALRTLRAALEADARPGFQEAN